MFLGILARTLTCGLTPCHVQTELIAKPRFHRVLPKPVPNLFLARSVLRETCQTSVQISVKFSLSLKVKRMAENQLHLNPECICFSTIDRLHFTKKLQASEKSGKGSKNGKYLLS